MHGAAMDTDEQVAQYLGMCPKSAVAIHVMNFDQVYSQFPPLQPFLNPHSQPLFPPNFLLFFLSLS